MNSTHLSAAQENLLRGYALAVTKAPHRLALTATRDAEEFWDRHILDALALCEVVPVKLPVRRLRVLDVGTGNGVPGIPLAVIKPEWTVDLLDSDNKKCGFVDMFVKSRTIVNCRVFAFRAEEFARTAHRAIYDLVIARALSKLPVTIELSIPFLKVGGILIVPHGTTAESELDRSKKAMKELSVELHPLSTAKALVFVKTAETSEKYPRAIGIPAKRPL